jgi:hypothetical protein
MVPSASLTGAEWSELTNLCEAAFKRPWGDFWESMGPGDHVIAEDEVGRIIAHGAIVDRLLYPGEATLRSGSVQAVAVLPEQQRSGLGTEVMEVIDRIVGGEYELGALGTGTHSFYARLGWIVWQGPTWIRERDGELVRSPGGDGGIMVLRTPTTPADLDLSLPIAIDWRDAARPAADVATPGHEIGTIATPEPPKEHR